MWCVWCVWVCGVCGDPVSEELHMLSEVYQSLVLEIFAWCVVCVCVGGVCGGECDVCSVCGCVGSVMCVGSVV